MGGSDKTCSTLRVLSLGLAMCLSSAFADTLVDESQPVPPCRTARADGGGSYQELVACARDAVSDEDMDEAARLWQEAVRHAQATPLEAAQAAVEASQVLSGQRHYEQALDVLREVDRHFGEAKTLPLRDVLGEALFLQGQLLENMERDDDALLAYNSVETRYGRQSELSLQNLSIRALFAQVAVFRRQDDTEQEIQVLDRIIDKYARQDQPLARLSAAQAMLAKARAEGRLGLRREVTLYENVIRLYGESDDPVLNRLVEKATRQRRRLGAFPVIRPQPDNQPVQGAAPVTGQPASVK